MLDLLSRWPVRYRSESAPSSRGHLWVTPGRIGRVGPDPKTRTKGKAQDDHTQLNGQQEEAGDLPQDLGHREAQGQLRVGSAQLDIPEDLQQDEDPEGTP